MLVLLEPVSGEQGGVLGRIVLYQVPDLWPAHLLQGRQKDLLSVEAVKCILGRLKSQ